jgi:hypothetical protein
MIRSFTKALALLVLVSASFSACKKDKDDSLAVTKENLAGTYKVASIKVKVTGIGEEDVTDSYLDACEKDDELVLKSDLQFNYVDAGTACSFNGSYESTWTLTDKKVAFDDYEGTVDKLTSKEMILVETETQSGVTWTTTYVFSKK